MIIQLNGIEYSVEAPCSIQELLIHLGRDKSPVVVELNGVALFPREFAHTQLHCHDCVEIIAIVAGG